MGTFSAISDDGPTQYNIIPYYILIGDYSLMDGLYKGQRLMIV